MAEKRSLDLAALPIETLAELLKRASGKPITTAMVRADVAAGAPQNPDGTLNLMHYAAWLAREAAT